MWGKEKRSMTGSSCNLHLSRYTCVNKKEELADGETNIWSCFYFRRLSFLGKQAREERSWWCVGTNPAATGVKSNWSHLTDCTSLQLSTTGGFRLYTFPSYHNCKRDSQSGRRKLLLSGGNDGSSDLCVINGLVWEKLLPAEDGDLNLIVMTLEDIRAAGLAWLF